MQQQIRDILNLAVFAPSGENSQPWRFAMKDNLLYVFNIPTRDNPVYNYRQRGSYVAHGALLENINIIAPTKGLLANIKLLPTAGADNLVAIVEFVNVEPKENKLASIIKIRTTNRKKYSETLLTDNQFLQIQDVAKDFPEVSVKFITLAEEKNKLAHIFSMNDRVMLEHQPLHDAVFDHICWTAEEEKKKKTGLYLKTMELPPPQQFVFKLLKYVIVAKFFKKIGLTKFIATENAKVYGSGPLFIAFIINNEDLNYIKLGMLMQRLWLNLTAIGLSAQPLAALPYLFDRINNGEIDDFSEEHLSLIKDSYASIADV